MRFPGLLAIALLVTLPTLSPSGSAYAQARNACMAACMAQRNCDAEYLTGMIYNPADKCQPYLNDCEWRCFSSSQRIYGAIAYDPKTTAWGMSNPSVNEEGAYVSALSFCLRHAANCEVVQTFSKTCAAISVGNNYVVAWAKGETSVEAELNATGACAKREPTDKGSCIIAHSYCYK